MRPFFPPRPHLGSGEEYIKNPKIQKSNGLVLTIELKKKGYIPVKMLVNLWIFGFLDFSLIGCIV